MALYKLALAQLSRKDAARLGVCLLILGLLPSALGMQEIAKVERVELQPLIAQVKRVRRLKRRNGMLVDQLHLSITFQQQAELIEGGDMALKHDAVHKIQRHRRILSRSGCEEHVLQRCFAMALGPIEAV